MTSTTTSDGTATRGLQTHRSGRSAEPQPIIDAIQRVQQTGVIHRGHLPLLELPGFGEPYTEDTPNRDPCGEPIPHVCDGCGRHVSFGRTCYRSVCPRCAPAWCLRTAAGQRNNQNDDRPGHVARLEATRKLKYATSPDGTLPKFHHLVIDIPADWNPAADDPLQKTFETIYDVMDELAIEGHIYYHPWRGDEEKKPSHLDPIENPPRQGQAVLFDDESWPYEQTDDDAGLEDDRGAWKRRQFQDRDWKGDDGVREELSFSPHFHLVVVGDYVKGKGVVERVQEETGFIIHRITPPGRKVSIRDLDAAARVVTYCLSHIGLYEDSAGNTRAAMRTHGSDIDQIDVYEETEYRSRLACRKAAPRTLGISGTRLTCDVPVPANPDLLAEFADLDDHNQDQDPQDSDLPDLDGPDGAVGVTGISAASTAGRPSAPAPGRRSSGTSSNPSDAVAGYGGRTWKPEAEDPDDEGDGDQRAWATAIPTQASTRADYEAAAEVEPCHGRFRHVAVARRLLDDDDWRDQAVHADQAREAYDAWLEETGGFD